MSSESLATQPAERKSTLPAQVVTRGITEAQWRTLCNNLYPGANPNSVLMVWDYCIARKLDPLKKPCHIVPMEVKDAKTNTYSWRDVVMPGIYEHRTTAQRTGEYLGHSKPQYGPPIEVFGVTAPEWCALTIYRWNASANTRAEFPVEVLFAEVVAVTKDKKTGEFKANSRWSRAPQQMLTKCAEAAGLREAFPDEIGGEQTAEEMEGQRHTDIVTETIQALPKPEGYDDALKAIQEAAEVSFATFEKAWQDARKEVRDYLTATEPDHFEALKAQAEKAGQESAQ